MSEQRGTGFSLADHLFNEETVAVLAKEYSVLDGFDPNQFSKAVLGGFEGRALLERLDWIADCLTPYLPDNFPDMARALETSMSTPLDPSLEDDDFGHFIHAVPGILTVRHGLDDHMERSLDLLYEATQRFSMEFYIRPFLNRYPDQTLERLSQWADDPNYHVRRLVSEGTRPRLPWAANVDLTPDQTLPFLDRLHGDSTRYVTRSVSNHLNDLTKSVPDRVMDHLESWRDSGRQESKELDWMTKHALRNQIKEGTPRALKMLGFDPDANFESSLELSPETVAMGDAVDVCVTLLSASDLPVLVDYIIDFPAKGGKRRRKVFKLKQAVAKAGMPLTLKKSHRLKGNASTFVLFPGEHHVTLQVNGRTRETASFMLT